MNKIFKVACIQMESGSDIGANVKQAEKYIKEAAGQGAELVATPENSCFIETDPEKKWQKAAVNPHPSLVRFAQLAEDLGIWLLAGSVKTPAYSSCEQEGSNAGTPAPGQKIEQRTGQENAKLYNRSYLFSPAGKIAAVYDKIHLYDVDLQSGERYRESAEFVPGGNAVTAYLDDLRVKIGLTICYDVRFANLYRDLARAGADIIVVPSAFTVPTGRAHWEIMLRARAIESGAYIMAPAQGGKHEDMRSTYGHSMIIGPWGEVLAHKDDDRPGVIYAEIDRSAVVRARAAIRQLEHDRRYQLPGD